MGQRLLEDPRNALVREFLRLIRELSPRFFLFENVKGLTVYPHRQVLEELVEAFDQLGYSVRQPWQVLNAVHYGVPQNRERLFLLGARHGLSLPAYPAPKPCTLPPLRPYFRPCHRPPPAPKPWAICPRPNGFRRYGKRIWSIPTSGASPRPMGQNCGA